MSKHKRKQGSAHPTESADPIVQQQTRGAAFLKQHRGNLAALGGLALFALVLFLLPGSKEFEVCPFTGRALQGIDVMDAGTIDPSEDAPMKAVDRANRGAESLTVVCRYTGNRHLVVTVQSPLEQCARRRFRKRIALTCQWPPDLI